MKQTKTVEQWLKELPESIRPKYMKTFKNKKVSCLSSALLKSYWYFSNNGDCYFNEGLYESLKWAEEG